jgi:hypothetical protein
MNAIPDPTRPMLLWSWNGDLRAERIRESLEAFHAQGFGGVFIHPRPGLITEYLSAEWFDLWGTALRECRRLGLGCHIYDENSFPSGFAGGHVVAEHPGFAACRLLKDAQSGEFRIGPVPASAWHAGFPMADSCRPEPVRRFLDCTHQAYARAFADSFGTDIVYVFTDEPETGTCEKGFAISPALLQAFQEEHGYDLAAHFAALCGNAPDSPSLRHDTQATLNRLFCQHFMRQNAETCEALGLRFTGHVREDQWPFPMANPSSMAALRWMHAPGIDLLAFQFQRGDLFDNAHWLMSVLEARSVAAQMGRSEVLCENGGGGGYNYGPDDLHVLDAFLLALGVNRFAAHLAHDSLAGTRKYDWPQTFSPHSPWWESLHQHNHWLHRVNSRLSEGRETRSLLVLHPTTTGWMHYVPAAYQPPGAPPHERLHALRNTHSRFLSSLVVAGLSFDLADETLLAEMGSVEATPDGMYLRVGEAVYSTVLFPPDMENLLDSTHSLLQDFAQNGGRLLAAGPLPSHVNGRPQHVSLPAQFPGEALLATLQSLHPPRIRSATGLQLPDSLLTRWVDLDDSGAWLFVCNPDREPLRADLQLEARTLAEVDGFTEQFHPVPLLEQDGLATFPLHLEAGEAKLFRVNPPATQTIIPRPQAETWMPLRLETCQREEPNVLALLSCDLDLPGQQLRDVPVLQADTALWKHFGFPQNPWRVSIQYKRRFLETPLPTQRPYTLTYRFQVDPAFLDVPASKHLYLAVEQADLYRVTCNGQELDGCAARPGFDPAMTELPLAESLQPGWNDLCLEAACLNIRAEIAPVLLRGEFLLRPTEHGFALAPVTAPLRGEDLRAEGCPFYAGRLRYRYRIASPLQGKFLLERPRECQASAVAVELPDGQRHWFPPGVQTLVCESPTPLAHLDLLLCGHLGNLLGPHLADGLPGGWTWEYAPSPSPSASAYRFHATGTTFPPLIGTPGLCADTVSS